MKPDNLEQFPKLSSIEKKNIYQVPDGLFDNLSYSLQLAVSGERKLSITDRICKALSIGMSSAIVLCMFFMSYCSFSGKSFSRKNTNELASVVLKAEDTRTNPPEGMQYPFSYYFVSFEPIK